MQKICIAKDISISQAPLSVGFSRQEYWSVLPSCSPEDLRKYIELHKRIIKMYTIDIYLTVNLIKSIIILTIICQ